MRVLRLPGSLCLWLPALLCVSAGVVGTVPQSPPAGAPTAITGITVIDGAGSAPTTRTVIIRGHLIDAVLAPDAAVPPGSTVIDGRGRFLIPGLWDMHVHLAVRPEPDLAERIMLPLFLAHGIVGVRDMGGPLERVIPLRERVKSGDLIGPRILTPGPFLDGPGDADPSFKRVTVPPDAKAALDDLLTAGVDFLKVQSNLGGDAYAAILAGARTRKAVVVGHVPVAITAEQAIAAGQRSIEHISPALVGDAGLLFACSNRSAELLGELRAIERERATSTPASISMREAALRRRLVDTYDASRAAGLGRLLRRGGTWIVPTLVWSDSFRPLRLDDDGSRLPLEYVPSATRARWQQRRAAYLKAAQPADYMNASDVSAVAHRAVRALHDAGAAVLAGTDTFDAFVLPGHSLHRELALLVESGLTPLEALQAATRAAAAYRGTSAHEGTIARGKRADVVILDADPLRDIANIGRVHAVVADGRLFTRSDLDRLLDGARAAAK